MIKTTLAVIVCFCILSCTTSDNHINIEEEKAEIIDVLNSETRAAFARNYEEWTTYWKHDDQLSKTYINFSDSSYSESVGWPEISQFVKTFIAEHPTTETPPAPLSDMTITVYGTGAWVYYEQYDALRGRKRETRLMEKVDGAWKIAGMHTTIYGAETAE